MTQPKPTGSASELQLQIDKFKALARELEADGDEAAWDERLRKLAKVKPESEKPE